jgi:hypothetical protein
MLNNLEDFLNFVEIEYKNINGQFNIEIAGDSDLFLQKNENEITFNFHENGGEREIEISIKYNNIDSEELLADFIKEFIDFLNETEGEFFNFTNESLEERLETLLSNLFGKNNYSINITGINPALDFKVTEKPFNREQLLELRDKAAKEKNKEDWEKYQNMLLDIKENATFKFLKNFKDFFDN